MLPLIVGIVAALALSAFLTATELSVLSLTDVFGAEEANRLSTYYDTKPLLFAVKPSLLQHLLDRHGDPFTRIGADETSQVQLALGSSGVPESFVVDGRGVIRYQHIGPIEPEHVPLILAELEKAR